MSNYSDSHFQKDKNTSWYMIANQIRQGSSVLDVGCSSGNFGQYLIKTNDCVVDGIELDKKDYLLAKNKLRNVYNLNIETDNIENIRGSYDYIYFGDVIEHLVKPTESLLKIKTLLKKPDGMVLFSIPNMAHISVRLMILRGEFEYGETGLLDKTHLHYYNLNEVYRVFNEAGFEIINLDYVKRDLPNKTTEYELNKIGLKANKEFLNLSKSVEWSAYQFVGAASPSKKSFKIARPKLSPPIDEMEKHFIYLNKVHKEQIKSHKSRIKELEKKIKILENTIDEKDKEILKRRGIRRLF